MIETMGEDELMKPNYSKLSLEPNGLANDHERMLENTFLSRVVTQCVQIKKFGAFRSIKAALEFHRRVTH